MTESKPQPFSRDDGTSDAMITILKDGTLALREREGEELVMLPMRLDPSGRLIIDASQFLVTQ